VFQHVAHHRRRATAGTYHGFGIDALIRVRRNINDHDRHLPALVRQPGRVAGACS
jgi:hypothetical protein